MEQLTLAQAILHKRPLTENEAAALVELIAPRCGVRDKRYYRGCLRAIHMAPMHPVYARVLVTPTPALLCEAKERASLRRALRRQIVMAPDVTLGQMVENKQPLSEEQVEEIVKFIASRCGVATKVELFSRLREIHNRPWHREYDCLQVAPTVEPRYCYGDRNRMHQLKKRLRTLIIVAPW